MDQGHTEAFFEHRKGERRPASLASDQDSDLRTSCFVHSLLNRGAVYPKNDEQSEHSGSANGTITSRELSKAELTDMAYGIRELAKRLSNLRFQLKVRNVFLLTKLHDRHLIVKTREICEWLLEQRQEDGTQYTVWVQDILEHNPSFDAKNILTKCPSYKARLHYWAADACRESPHAFDICIALGGDGTVLFASWLFQRVAPPVMAFALGSLGFLTKFDFNQYQLSLPKSFTEGVTISLRLRLEATIMRAQLQHGDKGRDLVDELVGRSCGDITTHKPDQAHTILNEIVVDRGPNPTMSSIEVFGGGDHLTTVQADGVCVATPTGSTAYNLAAGGSLCHPENPVILVTAIAPHTLSFRPIILPDTMVLRVGVPYDARSSCWASFDGKERTELKPGDYCTISASRYPFPTILPLAGNSQDWVDSISRTLSWNARQRQKQFDSTA
ncbi:putative NAD+ kinase [Piedraia hortae CBS 480.64]|uniref:Putative NAD+ kinase n=1 Tax=Piedraia hortae CBS 480.64 TaxID=1314780 RepID=A0A6A7C713_9PEZI|nr:putative NAD+ kinase [Piedraia hortae CBS 480.64]